MSVFLEWLVLWKIKYFILFVFFVARDRLFSFSVGFDGRAWGHSLLKKTNNFLDVLLKVRTELRVMYVLSSTCLYTVWIQRHLFFLSFFLPEYYSSPSTTLISSSLTDGCSSVNGVVADFFKITNGTGTTWKPYKVGCIQLMWFFFLVILSS